MALKSPRSSGSSKPAAKSAKKAPSPKKTSSPRTTKRTPKSSLAKGSKKTSKGPKRPKASKPGKLKKPITDRTALSREAKAAKPSESSKRTEEITKGLQESLAADKAQERAGAPLLDQDTKPSQPNSIGVPEPNPEKQAVKLFVNDYRQESLAPGQVAKPGVPTTEEDTYKGETYRLAESKDGRGDWTQWQDKDGGWNGVSARVSEVNGVSSYEQLKGNQYSIRPTQETRDEVRAQEPKELNVTPGESPTQVRGDISPKETERLKSALAKLPPSLREHSKNISVLPDLGGSATLDTDFGASTFVATQGQYSGTFGDQGTMELPKWQLQPEAGKPWTASNQKQLEEIVAHEGAHGAINKYIENNKEAWAARPEPTESISEYGLTNKEEDIAETAAYLSRNYQDITSGQAQKHIEMGNRIGSPEQTDEHGYGKPTAEKLFDTLRILTGFNHEAYVP